jgi:hypothetical protein
MPARVRTLVIEAPDTEAHVDFIDSAIVEVKREGKTLSIVVKVFSEDSYTWDQHEFSVPLRGV